MKLDLHYLFSAKYAQWIPLALISLFSLFIIIECAHLILSPLKIEAVSEHVPVISKQDMSSHILTSSLFGVYVPDNLSEANVKKSMLDVTLVGILLSDRPDDSQVIIRSSNGDEKTYKPGDPVPGEAVIKRITANGVLVERHGVLESLSLPKNELTFEPVPKPLKEE